MKYLFPEERELTAELSEEWRAEVVRALNEMTHTFSAKAQTRDRVDVVWRRLNFPHGFMTIIRQKLERLEPMFDDFGPHTPHKVNWEKVAEECGDVATYLVFMAAIALMWQKRMEESNG